MFKKLLSVFKVWKIFKYRPSLLIEAFRLLNKWDNIINYHPFGEWKHNLSSYITGSETSFQAHSAQNVMAQKDNSVSLTKEQLRELHIHIQVVVRHHYKHMNCMRRCLALKEMLEKRDIGCHFHIGVKFDENKQLSAHSWLSVNGVLVNDSEEEVSKYQEITSDNTLFESSYLNM